jgi:cobalt-zinc-cadmium efflux system outer membrane protein
VVRGEVRSRYAEAQAARALVAIGRQSVRNAEELSEAVRRKVEAGAASPAEAARADVELAGARLDLSEFEAGAALAEARLASLWDGRTLSGATLAPIPERLASAPERADVESLALAAPELQAIEARARSAESNLALQKSLAMPDLELEGGVRTGGAADDEVTYVAGVSLPLPLFDRNAGNVGAAVAERDRTRAALAGARRGRLLELDEGLVALERARTRCEALHGDILPAATRSHEAVLAGYLRGRFDYVDVLDARRAMLAAARAELDAYLAHTAAWVRLSRTLGGETALAGEDRR